MLPPPQTVFTEADLASEYLRRFYTEWSSKRAQRALPGTSALSAHSMRWALGKYTIIDLEGPRASPRFRYAYCSWEHVTNFGNDLTGTMLENNPNAAVRDAALEAYRLCVAQNAPVLSFRTIPHAAAEKFYQALVLPYGGPDGSAERLIVAIDFAAPA